MLEELILKCAEDHNLLVGQKILDTLGYNATCIYFSRTKANLSFYEYEGNYFTRVKGDNSSYSDCCVNIGWMLSNGEEYIHTFFISEFITKIGENLIFN